MRYKVISYSHTFIAWCFVENKWHRFPFSSCRKWSVGKINTVAMESFVIVTTEHATTANQSELTAVVTKCAARKWNACLANAGPSYLQARLMPSVRKIETATKDCAALKHTASLSARECCRRTKFVLYHLAGLHTVSTITVHVRRGWSVGSSGFDTKNGEF